MIQSNFPQIAADLDLARPSCHRAQRSINTDCDDITTAGNDGPTRRRKAWVMPLAFRAGGSYGSSHGAIGTPPRDRLASRLRMQQMLRLVPVLEHPERYDRLHQAEPAADSALTDLHLRQ
jgi:hypothetical protein